MIYSARDISQQLNARAEGYARWLLPNGKREGSEWVCGSVAGEEGKSLKVKIAGEKAGVFADFSGNDKGDLLTLTALNKNVKLGEAIKIAKEWLGIKDPESYVPKKTYTKPKQKDVRKFSDESAAEKYLISERCINLFTLQDFKVSEATGPGGVEYVFPSMSLNDGEVVNIKYIAVKRDERGKKMVRQSAGGAPSLFGWQTVDPEAREIIITEGEIDAMTWYQNGFAAVSVPWGAGNDDWIDYEWDTLQQFDTIWLHYDDDKEGQTNVAKVAQRLGLHRCMVVKLRGYKDANEALQKDEPESFFQAAIAAAKPLDPQQIKSPNDFLDKVLERFYPVSGQKPGFRPELFSGQLVQLPGEVTLWTGISGHGKSALLNQLILEAIVTGGYKSAMASMEMPGDVNLQRMLLQSEMATDMTRDQITKMLGWLSGRLWIYDLMGNVSPKLVMNLMDYSFARHGVRMFVIDSLMKCGIDSEDYNTQRVFLNDLCSFAMQTGTHVNLVAHARKGKDELDAPGKLDVKGSSDIINQPANVLSVWRNKGDASPGRARNDNRGAAEPDAIVYCNKQRDSGLEFKSSLLFLRDVYRFRRMIESPANLSILNQINPMEIPVNEEFEYDRTQQPAGDTN